MDPHQVEQDEVLRALVEAEAAKSDDFFTASASDGTTVFHDGLGDHGQRNFPLAHLNGLVRRGLLAKTGYRDFDDFTFAITANGRSYVERLDRSGLTALEMETQRADRAEANLRGNVERRQKLAGRLGFGVAAAVVLLVGIGLFLLGEAPGYRIAVGILTAVGVAGISIFGPVKRFTSSLAFRALTFIHEHF